MTVGSFNYGRALLAGSPVLGRGSLLYGLEYQQSDGPWRNPNRFAKYNGVLRYAQGSASDGFNVTATGYTAEWNATDQIPRRAVDVGLLDRFGTIDPTDGGSASRYSLSGEWRSSGKDTNRALTLYIIKSRLKLYSNFTFFLDNPVAGDQFEQAEKRLTFGGEASQTWTTRLWDRPISNKLGLQVRRDSLDPVALYSTVARARLATTREDRVTVASAAPYFSNSVEWTSWFRTVAGVRADFYRFDVDSNIAANSGKRRDAIVSPKISAIFGPWVNTEYFVNWGRGFHSNDARGTTLTVDPKTGEPAERVSPLVRTTGSEVGMRSALRRRRAGRRSHSRSARIGCVSRRDGRQRERLVRLGALALFRRASPHRGQHRSIAVDLTRECTRGLRVHEAGSCADRRLQPLQQQRSRDRLLLPIASAG